MKKLALFDFDGTLTTKDTLLEFFKFRDGILKFYKGMLLLAPVLVALKLKLLPNWKAKEVFLTYFLKNCSQEIFNLDCQKFAHDAIPGMLRQEAVVALNQHLESDDKIFIVSASPANWIENWVGQRSIDVLATKLDVKNGLLTGKLQGRNCYGVEKVRRIESVLDYNKYDQIFAYGDSRGDKEMLNLATHAFYKKFSTSGYQ